MSTTDEIPWKFISEDVLKGFFASKQITLTDSTAFFKDIKGICIFSRDRTPLARFASTLFLGPTTLSRLTDYIGRLVGLKISGFVIDMNKSMDSMLELLNSYLNKEIEDLTRTKLTSAFFDSEKSHIECELTYRYPYPKISELKYIVKKINFFIKEIDQNRFLVSIPISKRIDYSQTKILLKKVLEITKIDYKIQEIVISDFKSTDNRHIILRNIIENVEDFDNLGGIAYQAEQAEDIIAVEDAFEQIHRSRKGDIKPLVIKTLFEEIRSRGSFVNAVKICFFRGKRIVLIGYEYGSKDGNANLVLRLHHIRETKENVKKMIPDLALTKSTRDPMPRDARLEILYSFWEDAVKLFLDSLGL